MKLRTLEEIQEDEMLNPQLPPARLIPHSYDLRPGPVKRLALGFGDLLLAAPRLIWRLFCTSVDIAVILGIVGLVVFGLVYLFG